MNYLINFLKQVWSSISLPDLIESSTTAVTLPATGWYAAYRHGDDVQYFPLISWNIVYRDGEPVEAVGLVFVGNQPPFVEYADESPQFVGYQLNGNWATFPQMEEVSP